MLHATAVFVLVMLAAPATTDVGTGPQPAPHPISWELKFTFLDPQRIEVQLPGTDRPETFWYMVYTVTNPGGRAQMFFPTFQIVTDRLRVVDTDMGVSPLVFDAIAERHRTTHKYLVSPTKAIGTLLSGDDNARESVAIWRQVDLTNNNFSIYVAGLSGETRSVPNPTYDAAHPLTKEVVGPDGRPKVVDLNPSHFTLRKTLEIRYTLPGSPEGRLGAEPERRDVRWIMR